MNQAMRSKTCFKTYKTEAELKVTKILNKIDSLKLSNSYISRLDIPRNTEKKAFGGKAAGYLLWTAALIFVCLISALWVYEKRFGSGDCILKRPKFIKSSSFRPPEDCSMCEGVDDVVRLANISAEEFEYKYAYSSIPVIVTGATHGWKALREFDYKFFANFYKKGKFGKRIGRRHYLPYKSKLSFDEVFTMEEARANLSGAPWYVGWSTCCEQEVTKLRTYYERPYFLPRTAESCNQDWIFIGGPGQGSHMHVDYVTHMSWQAQVRGHKLWQLAPPPECLYRCRWINFTVSPGEIVVMNTSRWFHKTTALPGDISISIGAEYD